MVNRIESFRLQYARRAIVPLLRLMGPHITARLATQIGRTLFQTNDRIRQQAESRIGNAIGSTAAAPVARASIDHYTRFWAEAIFIPRRLKPRRWQKYVSVENAAAWTHLVQAHRPTIIGTAYHGNPAAAACVLGHLFGKVTIIADTHLLVRIPAIPSFVAACPQVNLLDRAEAHNRLPAILERAGCVLTIAEHARARGRRIPMSFLGRQFGAYPTIGLLARAYGANVAAMTCTRHPKDAFRFNMRLLETIDGRAVSDEDEIVRRLLKALERSVLRTPEQYWWFGNPEHKAQSGIALNESGGSHGDVQINRKSRAGRRRHRKGRAGIDADLLLKGKSNRCRSPEQIEQ